MKGGNTSNLDRAGWSDGAFSLTFTRREREQLLDDYLKSVSHPAEGRRGFAESGVEATALLQTLLVGGGKAFLQAVFPAGPAGILKLPASGYTTCGRAQVAFVKPLEHVPTF